MSTKQDPHFKPFDLVSEFKPSGDQPQAIEELMDGLDSGLAHQVLLGVTGCFRVLLGVTG